MLNELEGYYDIKRLGWDTKTFPVVNIRDDIRGREEIQAGIIRPPATSEFAAKPFVATADL